MNANELITHAFYLSNIVARDLQTVTGSQLSDALELLNDILSEKSMSGRYIPYYGHTTFNTVVGQEEYDVPNLIDTSSVTFELNEVRYAMRRTDRRAYFGSSRVNGIKSLPLTYFAERQLNGTKLYLYFLPVDVYEVEITGKFALQSVTADTDLEPILDRFYINYLKYLLAQRICDFYNKEFEPYKVKTLRTIEDELNDIAPLDLSAEVLSTMGTRKGYNWAQINLGRGWTAR